MINRNRIHWACRRGMLELDLFLLPFFNAKFDTLTSDEQEDFYVLLEESDPTLQDWLMNNSEVSNAKFSNHTPILSIKP